KRFGVDADFIDTRKSENMASAVRDETRLIFIETPTNPTLGITDLADAARLAKDNELYLVVDNTFATPYLQTPIEFGADVVVHSLTKYIGGHSDLVGGAAAFSRGFAENKESMRRVKRAVDDFGTNFNPEDAFLALRGLETLDIRMIRHCENAQYVAEYLESHEKIERVYYPGLKSFPQYDLAKRQMKMSGAMVWFIMKDGYDAGERLMNNVKLCSLAVSLGSTATLIQHPASMTHKIIPREEREKIGIVDGGVRLSVGLEDKEDIVWDLDQALNKV
ncbi:MAG: aminotransferase class I/II-fold pyridoxal phosphate-dependent enzyme, partial [Candidatus Bathyarchaeota archaeon]|nr:aminotransferase class I/II-fold pyridoxal phosphate-dependent enzyme [Candidatus Bathyarchaeota archaeon]